MLGVLKVRVGCLHADWATWVESNVNRNVVGRTLRQVAKEKLEAARHDTLVIYTPLF